MKAVIYQGKGRVAVESIPMPEMRHDSDVLVRVKAASICGTDVRIYWGPMADLFGMKPGDPLGHEIVGVVEEVGRAVKRFERGQRVVSPFSTYCGHCYYCEHDNLTRCTGMRVFGVGAQWGGGLAGGQAEYVVVPDADRTLLALDERVSDEHATVLPDVLTGVYAGMEGIRAGDSVAVTGCGPTGLAAVMCARLLGAGKIFAVDHHEDRLRIASEMGAIPIHFDRENAGDVVRAGTDGRGADVVAETVGKSGAIGTALPLARPYGAVILFGYIAPGETIDIGEASLRHVSLRAALIPSIRRYQPRVMQLIAEGRLDPTPLLSHTLPLEQAPLAYEMMAERQDGAIKIVLKP